jgi:[NiFe] hydrogenase assembly HybE family chaperone
MTSAPDVAAYAARIETYFQDVHVRAMADVPICNPALEVACVGFQIWRDQIFGVVLTPWFMNVWLAPGMSAPPVLAAPGATQTVPLPCGKVDFLVSEIDSFGRVLMASLFSPMQDFLDQEAALAAAQAAAEALLDPGFEGEAQDTPAAPVQRESVEARAEKYRRAEEAEATPEKAQLDRRALLRGGFAGRSAP